MDFCAREGCSKRGTKRCSACKHTLYCSEACQRSAWAAHKKGCKIQATLNKINDQHAARPPPTPRTTHCTGCNVRYTEDYPADQTCPDCGYTTCESCACHDDRGSCYCQSSNFGYRYCEREPKPYHISSHTGKLYSGDYHPDKNATEFGPDVRPDLYEAAPRKCRSCGEVRLCIKASSAQWYRQEYNREVDRLFPPNNPLNMLAAMGGLAGLGGLGGLGGFGR